MAGAEIAGIPHTDHGVVEKDEVSYSLDHKARSLHKAQGVKYVTNKKAQEQPTGLFARIQLGKETGLPAGLSTWNSRWHFGSNFD